MNNEKEEIFFLQIMNTLVYRESEDGSFEKMKWMMPRVIVNVVGG